MRRYCRLAFLLMWACGLLPRAVEAQTPTTPSVEEQLRRLPVSPRVRGLQLRELIKGHLQRNNPAQIPALLAWQREQPADSLLALRPYEEWTLLAAIGEFYELANRVRRPGGYSPEQQQALEQLPDDGLFEAAIDRVRADEESLRAVARAARFLPEDSAFLQLYLTLLTAEAHQLQPAQLDEQVKAFLRLYPETDYGYLLHSFTTPEYTPSRFSYGLDFHSGTGLLSGTLPTYFRHGLNFGHGFELGWDQYRLYLRNYIGMGRTRQAFGYGGSWHPGLKVNYFVPEVSVGYQLYESKVLRFTPFVGLSAFMISPADTREGQPGHGLDMNLRGPLTAGLNFDFKFATTQSSSYGMQEGGHWMVKLRGGVRGGKARHNADFRGTIFYLDLGIGGFGRRLKPQHP